MALMPRILSACVLVCLASSQAAPDQASCTTPVGDTSSPGLEQVQMPNSVDVEVHDGDTTSLMQAKQQVFKRAIATDRSSAQPSTSKDDGDDEESVYISKAMCVSDYMVKAYDIAFRRHGANLVTLGCIGDKETGWFYASFRCAEQMSLWVGGKPQAVTVAGPTKMTTEDASQFSGEVKAAATAASGSASVSRGTSSSGGYEFMSREFSSEMALANALRQSPDAMARLKRSGAKIVTGVLVLSAASSSSSKTDMAGSVTAGDATGKLGGSASGTSTSTVGVELPSKQTLAYEISTPEFDEHGKFLGLKKDEMCDRDDGWLGVCTTCGLGR